MSYLNALRDPRVIYAVNTGQIDDTNVKEVTSFLENIMRKSQKPEPKVEIPEFGYVVVDNMYASFARKIEHGQEAEQETDLENVLNLIDQGSLIKCGVDKARSATFYMPGNANPREIKKLAAETTSRLEKALSEYERRLNRHQGTFEMKNSVRHLQHRVKTQKATLTFLEKH